ncbi:MAG: hypothetical protein N3D15_02010 [Syntrophorhabdaceae bacterium]|nr:hypothetical protein [Syntrophorhabdaceae bacterium]
MAKDLALKKTILLFVLVILFLFTCTWTAMGVERKIKNMPRPQVPPKQQQVDVIIDDSNLQDNLKKAEEMLKKGEFQTSLNTSLKIYDYTRSVLATINLLQKQYEKIAADQKTPLKDREDLLIKMQRMDNLIGRYKKAKEQSALNIGHIYTKRGEIDKARRYLFEVLESAPFDLKKDSTWMRAKTLLLEAYSLEGEF